jgi:hypothetical protein
LLLQPVALPTGYIHGYEIIGDCDFALVLRVNERADKLGYLCGGFVDQAFEYGFYLSL